MSAVKTCPLDPAELVARFRAIAAAHGFREEPMGESGGVPLLAFTRRARRPGPRIYVSAGVHGDEPAAPVALLAACQQGVFDDRATWFLVPMINPTGFSRHQRDNATGIDLNRDYLSLKAPEVRSHVAWLRRQPRFDLAVCLHEDWEAVGFYHYELSRQIDPGFSRQIRATAAEYLPIEAGEVIDGRPVDEPGIIRPESDPALREHWPEAIYLFRHHSDHCLTFETPSPQAMPDRIAANVAALSTACRAYLDLS